MTLTAEQHVKLSTLTVAINELLDKNEAIISDALTMDAETICMHLIKFLAMIHVSVTITYNDVEDNYKISL